MPFYRAQAFQMSSDTVHPASFGQPSPGVASSVAEVHFGKVGDRLWVRAKMYEPLIPSPNVTSNTSSSSSATTPGTSGITGANVQSNVPKKEEKQPKGTPVSTTTTTTWPDRKDKKPQMKSTVEQILTTGECEERFRDFCKVLAPALFGRWGRIEMAWHQPGVDAWRQKQAFRLASGVRPELTYANVDTEYKAFLTEQAEYAVSMTLNVLLSVQPKMRLHHILRQADLLQAEFISLCSAVYLVPEQRATAARSYRGNASAAQVSRDIVAKDTRAHLRTMYTRFRLGPNDRFVPRALPRTDIV